MKKLLDILTNNHGHWVGDGFPVHSLFSYHNGADRVSPFLLFDNAGPYDFAPNEAAPRGVGTHPHRGFETVTIVYDGEVSHRDSAGGGGTIGKDEVQWMTAGSGVVHQEFHSAEYSRSGGPFRMVQLWVNLPAKDKMTTPRYQALTRDTIPSVALNGGKARIIAGDFAGTRGPAQTFTPVNMWDLRLEAGADVTLPVPDGHTTLIAVVAGQANVGDTATAENQVALLSRDGEGARVRTDAPATLLVLTGQPIDEPVVGHGPFVMNTDAEIRQAVADFQAGRFGGIAA